MILAKEKQEETLSAYFTGLAQKDGDPGLNKSRGFKKDDLRGSFNHYQARRNSDLITAINNGMRAYILHVKRMQEQSPQPKADKKNAPAYKG